MAQNKGLIIREAQLSDSRLYYHWANDPIVRKMAFHSEPIPWESHCRWFERKLKSDKSHLTICYTDDKPIGQVRFDEVASGEFEIDISVDSGLRSKGQGKEMLSAAIDYVQKKYQINVFVAEVKAENIPSQKMFLAVGFELQKVENLVNYYKLQLS